MPHQRPSPRFIGEEALPFRELVSGDVGES
jgi:hypothetical protein